MFLPIVNAKSLMRVSLSAFLLSLMLIKGDLSNASAVGLQCHLTFSITDLEQRVVETYQHDQEGSFQCNGSLDKLISAWLFCVVMAIPSN